jgi:hypothetical protein
MEINFKTDNAAFGDDADTRADEIERILETIVERIREEGIDAGTIRDLNGNTVGTWAL